MDVESVLSDTTSVKRVHLVTCVGPVNGLSSDRLLSTRHFARIASGI